MIVHELNLCTNAEKCTYHIWGPSDRAEKTLGFILHSSPSLSRAYNEFFPPKPLTSRHDDGGVPYEEGMLGSCGWFGLFICYFLGKSGQAIISYTSEVFGIPKLGPTPAQQPHLPSWPLGTPFPEPWLDDVTDR